MTFVSYTPLDAIGTIAGLNLLEKIATNFWQGTFLGEGILAIFVFLSLAKIAVDGIMEHKYESALFEFAKLAIAILLFTVKTSTTIFDMDIINFGYARKAAEIGSNTAGNIGNDLLGINNTNPTSAQFNVPNVPLMADIYAVPDNLAYELTNIMLDPKKTMTIDLASIVLDPKRILNYGYNSMYDAATDKGSLDEAFALCYDKKAYKTFRKYVKPADKTNTCVTNPFISFTGPTCTVNVSATCQKFNDAWAKAVENIENQMEKEGHVGSATFNAVNKMVYLIKSGQLENSSKYKQEFIGSELKELNEDAKDYKKMNNSYSSTGNLGTTSNGPITNNASAALGGTQSWVDEHVAANLLPREFFEDLMIHMQEYAIAIMFILLPFVVILGLLPIFGNNFKLIIKYAISFFLIKLWFPVLWLVYISMVDISALLSSTVNINHEIYNGIEYAITTFTGQPAFAAQQSPQPATPTPTQQSNPYNALIVAAEANKYSELNNLILETMYTTIPLVLGSSATYLVGKGMIDTGVAVAAEGMYLSKFALGKLGKLPGLFRRGGNDDLPTDDNNPSDKNTPNKQPGKEEEDIEKENTNKNPNGTNGGNSNNGDNTNTNSNNIDINKDNPDGPNNGGGGSGGSGDGVTGSGEGEITETIEEDFEDLGTYASEDAPEIADWLLEGLAVVALPVGM